MGFKLATQSNLLYYIGNYIRNRVSALGMYVQQQQQHYSFTSLEILKCPPILVQFALRSPYSKNCRTTSLSALHLPPSSHRLQTRPFMSTLPLISCCCRKNRAFDDLLYGEKSSTEARNVCGP